MTPRTVVVPLDGSRFAERALPVARSLAERLGGRLLLLTTRWDDDARDPSSYLERMASEQDAASTDVLLVQDRPAPQAIQVALEEDENRIVCMTSHGRGRLRWALLGSVAEEVVRSARRPVVLVGRHCSDDPPVLLSHHLVACVDASNVADPVLPIAAEWAKALALDVHLTHVVHPLDVQDAEHPPAALPAMIARLRAEGVDATPVVVRRSYVPGALADYAGELPAALVLMTSHTRTGVERVALGSVAMGTLALSPCPVIVTRAP
jgi:nucleotide-binding universal stress UspA family protein